MFDGSDDLSAHGEQGSHAQMSLSRRS